MSELIKSIDEAYLNPEDQSITNKSHRLFLSHTFILPIKKSSTTDKEPEALFFAEDDNFFLPLFSNEDYFRAWAKESINEMDWLHILGKDLIAGSGSKSYLCLDIGEKHYKEFSPSEILKLKQVIMKLEKIAKGTAAKETSPRK